MPETLRGDLNPGVTFVHSSRVRYEAKFDLNSVVRHQETSRPVHQSAPEVHCLPDLDSDNPEVSSTTLLIYDALHLCCRSS